MLVAGIFSFSQNIFYTLKRKFHHLKDVIGSSLQVKCVHYKQVNQSVEDAGVVFVKGADERKKFFEKINNQ